MVFSATLVYGSTLSKTYRYKSHSTSFYGPVTPSGHVDIRKTGSLYFSQLYFNTKELWFKPCRSLCHIYLSRCIVD